LLAEGPAKSDEQATHQHGRRPRPPPGGRLTVFRPERGAPTRAARHSQLFTATGVVVLLVLLRVDFPLMWGIHGLLLELLGQAAFGVASGVCDMEITLHSPLLGQNSLLGRQRMVTEGQHLDADGAGGSPALADRVSVVGFLFWAWLLGGPERFSGSTISLPDLDARRASSGDALACRHGRV